MEVQNANRPCVMGVTHTVAAGHYMSAQAGLQMLEAGGNAIDAGVAAGIATGVLEGIHVSIGRVAPILIWLAERGEAVTISGLGSRPKKASAEYLQKHHGLPPAPPQPWADLPKVLELAKRPNAVIKVSGACTLSREPYPFPDIWDPLARVFDAWGFDRCLWGTDWTRAFAVVNYEQAVEPFLKTSRLSDTERAMLMGGATAKAYGWSPKKG
jgi:hypothetical protein